MIQFDEHIFEMGWNHRLEFPWDVPTPFRRRLKELDGCTNLNELRAAINLGQINGFLGCKKESGWCYKVGPEPSDLMDLWGP